MRDTFRNFHLSGPELKEFGYRVFTSLPNDINDFMAFDMSMGQNTVEEVGSAYTAFSKIKTDSLAIGDLMETTDEVEAVMDKCRKTYNSCMYFAKKAFPKKRAMHHKFGLNDYDEARQNHPKMIVFMQTLSSVVDEYRNVLLNAGCPEDQINLVSKLTRELVAANNKQELNKKDRGVLTVERTEAYNNLVNVLKPINDVARIIYADNSGKMDLYVFPQPKYSPSSNNEGENGNEDPELDDAPEASDQ